MSIAFMRILLSTFFLCSGLALAATPSYPVLTYSTYLRDSFTPKAIATDSPETSTWPETPSSIRRLRRPPCWW